MTKTAYRPRICEICHRALEHASTGRPRLTCGDRCRQMKRRRYFYAGCAQQRHREQARRKAEKQIHKWEKQSGLDFKTVPAYHFDPYAMSLYDRLMIYLPRGMAVQTCWTCARPYMPDGRKSPTCSKTCQRKRVKYFKAVKMSFYHKPRVPDGEMIPYLNAGKRLGLCAHCGDPFMPTRRDRKYCGDKCRKAAWERSRSGLRHWPYGSTPVKKYCVHCGKKFTLTSPNKLTYQEYCTRECFRRLQNYLNVAKARKTRPQLRCINCESPIGTDGRRRYCATCVQFSARDGMRRSRARQRGLALGILVQLPSGVRLPIRERESVMVAGD